MKRIFKALMISSFAISLAGCNVNYFTVHRKDISIYSLINEGEGGKDISSYKKEDITCLTVGGEDYVPYLTLEDYNKMLLPHKNNIFNFIVSDFNGSAMWAVTYNNTYYFACEFNQSAKTVSVSGNASMAFTTSKDYSKTSLYLGAEISGEYITSSSKPIVYSYENIPYRVFVHDDKTYLPLSLIDTVISPFTGISHYYSYQSIYQFIDKDELKTVKFNKNDKEYTAFSEAKEIINNEMNSVMPDHLKEDRLNSFLFVFENIYGLKSTRRIDSMIDLFNEEGLLDGFSSSDNEVRNKALADVFAYLDDGHTGINDKFDNPWSTGGYNQFGPHLTEMMQTKDTLSRARKDFYDKQGVELGGIVYLNDEVAYLPFDGFTIMDDAFNEDKTPKEEIYTEDTFFYLARQLETIKNKGGVKKVVIDISTNGGGILGVMMKILSLLSKNNSSKVFLKTDKARTTEKDVTKVDSNLDGVFDLDDVYGDDFKFYLLTSCYSFSCGNALPFLAQQQNIAKIIGQDSGGGECSVEQSFLPSGESYVHSSLMHIGFVENDYDRWIGSEETAKAEKLIDIDKYYDVSTLLSSL